MRRFALVMLVVAAGCGGQEECDIDEIKADLVAECSSDCSDDMCMERCPCEVDVLADRLSCEDLRSRRLHNDDASAALVQCFTM